MKGMDKNKLINRIRKLAIASLKLIMLFLLSLLIEQAINVLLNGNSVAFVEFTLNELINNLLIKLLIKVVITIKKRGGKENELNLRK